MSGLAITVSEDGTITIVLPADTLPVAVQACPKLEHFDETSNGFLEPTITDVVVFAKEVARVLEAEEEDGTTIVHKMFDTAFLVAVEYGAEGILMPDDPEYPA